MSKNKFTVTERMKAICSEVIPGKIAADIGTDHGIVPMYLLTSKTVPFCILSDINKGPILKARENLFTSGLDTSSFRLCLGNGLEVLKPGEAATVIIAGMGGELIQSIMLNSKEVAQSVERFVLQPRTKSSVLRRALLENGYAIVGERLAREGNRICQIITVEHADRTTLPKEEFPDELDLFIPPMLYERQDPLLEKFLKNKRQAAEMILEGIKDKNTPEMDEKRAFWTSRVKQIDDMLSKINEK